jgi:hypothetical protein
MTKEWMSTRSDNEYQVTLPNEIVCKIIQVLWTSCQYDANHRYKAFCAGATMRATYYLRRNMLMEMTETCMDEASRKGHLDLLDWWKTETRLTLVDLAHRYTTKSITFAAMNGRLDVLDWWKGSGLKLKCDADSICSAASSKVLDWWKQNDMPFLYCNKSPVDVAMTSGKWDIIEWWFKCSDQPVVFQCPSTLFVQKKLLQI